MAGRAGVYLLRVASFSHLETVFLHCYLTLMSMVSAICIIFIREHLWFGLQTRLSVPFGHSTASSSWISLSGSSADSFFWGDPADWIQTQHSSSTRTTHFLGDANIQLPSQTGLSRLPVCSFWSFSQFYIQAVHLNLAFSNGSVRHGPHGWFPCVSLFLCVKWLCGECFSLSSQDCVSDFTPFSVFLSLLLLEPVSLSSSTKPFTLSSVHRQTSFSDQELLPMIYFTFSAWTSIILPLSSSSISLKRSLLSLVQIAGFRVAPPTWLVLIWQWK